ncbi:3TM-type holin [Maritalea mediterranea]|uniref:Holin family protein n=1 Tax=Maritalea mediterranea TaxID=2909667 RepID=A0ABS9E6V0_9HYPH|nr:3TM-type holin [Maritalea mediterranea]MCF4098605.1 holin family protein [Maritalea mediterranea]
MNVLTVIIERVGAIIDKVVPNRAEADRMKNEITTALISQQTELNKVMGDIAKIEVSGTAFQRNWRPTLAWMVVLLWPYNFILRPILNHYGLFGVLPEIDSNDMVILTTMWTTVYGLGRSFEKSGSKIEIGGKKSNDG